MISFVDLYPKVRRNFGEAVEVGKADRLYLGKEIINIASECGMIVKPCAEGDELAACGAGGRLCTEPSAGIVDRSSGENEPGG